MLIARHRAPDRFCQMVNQICRATVCTFGILLCLILLLPEPADAEEVDLALILSVDISYSMDEDEQRLQRLGYISAITAPQTLNAIKSGLLGKIAVAYVEWAGSYSQYLLVDWHLIDDRGSAEKFAAALSEAPIRRVYRTSISEALAFSSTLFDRLPYEALRRTIDVSGDGPNNQGRLVADIRNRIVQQQITINGLPLLLKRPEYTWFDIPNLDEYYEQCVIGGPSAFSIPVRHIKDFNEAVRMKLVLEIAQAPLPVDLRSPPLSQTVADKSDPHLCTIGERLWQERMRLITP
ncbi:MAG: DUF1194 domain-containing protein [Stappiaceae bacterium]